MLIVNPCPACKRDIPTPEIERFAVLERGCRTGTCSSCGVQLKRNVWWKAAGRATSSSALLIMAATYPGWMPSMTTGYFFALGLWSVSLMFSFNGRMIVRAKASPA